jgi:hypothetical protein
VGLVIATVLLTACGEEGTAAIDRSAQEPADRAAPVPSPEPEALEQELGAAAPGSFDVDTVDDSLIAGAAATWLNQLGLAETDIAVWRERIGRACTEGAWIPEVAGRLAREFIAVDLEKSVRSEELPDPTVGEGAVALWVAAAQVCGKDHFPPEALAAGPSSIAEYPVLTPGQTTETPADFDADAELSTYLEQNPDVVILATFQWQGGLVAVTDNGPEGIFVERYADPIVIILPEPLGGGASGGACADYGWNRRGGTGRGFMILVAERPGLTFRFQEPVEIDFVPIGDSGRSVALVDLSDQPRDQDPVVTDQAGALVPCVQ